MGLVWLGLARAQVLGPQAQKSQKKSFLVMNVVMKGTILRKPSRLGPREILGPLGPMGPWPLIGNMDNPGCGSMGNLGVWEHG